MTDNIEKQSSVGLAAGAHMAQAAITNRLLRNKKVAQGIASHANAGFVGKQVPKQTRMEALKGVVSPELAIMQRESHHLGSNVRKILQEQGVVSKGGQLSKRDAVVLRRLSRGDFSKVLGKDGTASPIARAAVEAAEKSKVIPAGSFSRILKIKDPEKRKAAIQELEKVWKDKSNPLTSNVLANITKPNVAAKDLVAGKGRSSAPEMIAGNVPVALADPITGGVNALKAAIASDAAGKVPAVRKVKQKVAEKLTVNPAQRAFEQGTRGKPLPAGGGFNKLNTNLLNPIGGQSAKLGNELGQVVGKYAPTDAAAKSGFQKLASENKYLMKLKERTAI